MTPTLAQHNFASLPGICPLGGVILNDFHLNIGVFCNDGLYSLPINIPLTLFSHQAALIVYAVPGLSQLSLTYSVTTTTIIGLINVCYAYHSLRQIQITFMQLAEVSYQPWQNVQTQVYMKGNRTSVLLLVRPYTDIDIQWIGNYKQLASCHVELESACTNDKFYMHSPIYSMQYQVQPHVKGVQCLPWNTLSESHAYSSATGLPNVNSATGLPIKSFDTALPSTISLLHSTFILEHIHCSNGGPHIIMTTSAEVSVTRGIDFMQTVANVEVRIMDMLDPAAFQKRVFEANITSDDLPQEGEMVCCSVGEHMHAIPTNAGLGLAFHISGNTKYRGKISIVSTFVMLFEASSHSKGGM